ncbi:hypothetical protein DM01DRAFT_1335618 [Hesseltinella vesiculosa]|uniref:Endopeptidase S2P n=1 Tax=Hesseltinella vesiculosa TaxID=101127 RepID=A0A1X2GI85_9FUNG|nr:hypothetical protein DM01DRAFT_1335618 [Hesseltinella vesiculosa]
MDVFSILWQFICLWLVIYVVIFAIRFYSSQSLTWNQSTWPLTRSSSILPTHGQARENGLNLNDQEDTSKGQRPKDEWTVRLFQVRYTTQRLNGLFSSCARLCPAFWHVWFSLGALVACLAMIVSVAIMLIAAVKMIIAFHRLLLAQDSSSHRLMKREEPVTASSDDPLFLPMIPGVTLPMSHIGYYLISLLVCGVIHEAGHAIASFAEQVQIQSCGLFFIYIYPGAFVNVPDQYLQLLSPFRQLKIVCAGVWHNLVLYLWTLVLLQGGLKLLLECAGWQSLEGNGGVSVVKVRSQSPMYPHLPPSSIIYQLDDLDLENNLVDWNQFLLNKDGRNVLPQLGFCAAMEASTTSLDCCEIDDTYPFGKSANASVSCFKNYHAENGSRKPELLSCLSTIQVLGARHPERCEHDHECSQPTMKCVTPFTPSPSGQVVRIYARMPDWWSQGDRDKVFIFEGELVDIWESIKVGILQPKSWLLPAWLPHRTELLLRYISSFTLALCLLNILPAFKLDGDFAVQLLLTMLFQPNPSTTRTMTRLHTLLIKMISYLAGFVIVSSILFGLLTTT